MNERMIDVPGVGVVAFPLTMSDEQIAAVIKRQLTPPTMSDKLKDSFVGGIMRGVRDIPDAGAQLVTRGLEAVSPAGSGMEQFFRGERERVEGINRDAEREYQHEWRNGNMVGKTDFGRVVGNIAATVPAAASIAPIRGGMSIPQLAGRGAVQGATIAPMSQQVQNTNDQSFWEQKLQQAGVGGAFGAGGAVVGDKVANLVQGARRASLPGATAAAGSTGGSVRASGGGSVLGQIGDDPTSALTSTQKQLIDRGRDLGLRTTPGQASGSRALQQMEARLESNPLTSGPFNTLKIGNQQAINRAAAKGIGETADVLDSSVLARAESRLGDIFNKVADRVPKAVIGDDIVNTLATIEDDVSGVALTPLMNNKLVQRVFGIAAKGEATGAELRSLSSKLGRAAKNNIKTDPEFGIALFRVKDIVDDVVSNNLDDATRETFDAARGQYRNLVTLLSRNNVVNPSSGNVSGANLAGALMQRDKSGFTMGRNNSDMYDAARFAQAFRPLVSDSGTATRSMPLGPIDFLLSLPTNAATSGYLSGPSVGAAQLYGRGIAPNAGGDAAARMIRGVGGPAGVGYGYGLLNE
jgi:hypothetical protein